VVGEIFGAIGLDCGEVGIWEAGVVDYYRGVDCVDYEGLTTEIRECFSKRLGGWTSWYIISVLVYKSG